MKGADLTNATVVEYLWRLENKKPEQKLERTRLRLYCRRLIYKQRGDVIPINRKERIDAGTQKGPVACARPALLHKPITKESITNECQ